jgi:DNA-binding MarR family transcriptional regulator
MSMDEVKVFAAHLQRQLYQLVRACELCDRACLTQNGVTTSQGYTLLAFPDDGCLTMNELSDTMNLSNSTMTRMVDQLVQKGLVRRKADESDRRIVLVELTDQGQATRDTLEKALQGLFAQILDGIPADERPLILRALEQVTQSVAQVLDTNNCCSE